MVLRTIKFWFRKETLDQQLRDIAAMDQYAKALAAGEKRILAQGANGELYSYPPEE